MNQNSNFPPLQRQSVNPGASAHGVPSSQPAFDVPAGGSADHSAYSRTGAGYNLSPAPPGFGGSGTAPAPGARPYRGTVQTAGAPGPEDSMAKKKKTSRDYAVSLLIKLGVTAAALILLLTVFIGVFVSHNNAGYPMVKDGDLCITSRLATLRQGDLIAYRDNGMIRFGRVIAFEGDTVEIMNDFIAVNGFGLYEEAVYPTTPEGAAITFPYTVPDNCVFVLNDYRSDLSDSRTLGGVPVRDVKGKVILLMRRRGL